MSALVSVLLGISIATAKAIATDQVVELQSGDKVVIRADGTMGHYDSRGHPTPMREGVVMTAKDGSRLMMKNQSLWREVLEAAGSAYARAIGESYLLKGTARSIELNDGSRLAIGGDGSMVHYDVGGNRVVMMDGEVMIAKDGSRILMVNGAVWREAAKSGAAGPTKP